MKNRLVFAALFLLPACFFLTGFLQSPVGEVLLTAVFGETRGDHLHNGIDLGRGGQAVFPVREGEIVFYTDRKDHPLIELFGNGNLAVMQHPGGGRSYYYHLEEGSVEGMERKVVGTNVQIGISGNSGRSFGAHLHLSWTERDRFLNPLGVLPPVTDNVAPEITSIIFIVGNREITIPREYKLTGVDDFILAARAHDQNEQTRKLASAGIHKIAFYIDDRMIMEYSFDSIDIVNGRTLLNGKLPFERVFRNGLYLGGKYRNILGTHLFRVRVWDRNGNTATREAKVNFR